MTTSVQLMWPNGRCQVCGCGLSTEGACVNQDCTQAHEPDCQVIGSPDLYSCDCEVRAVVAEVFGQRAADALDYHERGCCADNDYDMDLGIDRASAMRWIPPEADEQEEERPW